MKIVQRLAFIALANFGAASVVCAYPSASISGPGAVFTGTGYTMTASGSDDIDYIRNLSITRDGQYLTTVHDWGWDHTFSTNVYETAPGGATTRNYMAIVDTDNYTAYSSCSVLVIQNHPPLGSFDFADSSVNWGTNLTAAGWAADWEMGAPVAIVKFYVDGSYAGSANLGGDRLDVANALQQPTWRYCGFNWSYGTSGLSIGSHTIQAVAYDAQGLSTDLGTRNFSVTNRAPSASLTIKGATSGTVTAVMGETLTITISGSDPDGNLRAVNLWVLTPATSWRNIRSDNSINGGFVENSTTDNAINSGGANVGSLGAVNRTFTISLIQGFGTYMFVARAFDAVQNSASQQVSVTVANRPPSAAITASTYNINFGQSVTVTATGSDPDGNLYYVAFMSYNQATYFRPGSVNYSHIGWNGYVAQAGWSGQNFDNDTASGYGPVTKSATWQPQSGSVGAWSFLIYDGDTTGAQASAWTLGSSATLTINKAQPSTYFASKNITGTHILTSDDLGASFANPYSGSVAVPTGTITYSITSASGSGASPINGAVTVGTVLYPGTYTIQAFYPGDANYNAATANATFTINNRGPQSQIRASATTISFGQSITFYTDGSDLDGNLNYLSAYVRTPSRAAPDWGGSWININSATFSLTDNSTLTTTYTPLSTGTWDYHGNAADILGVYANNGTSSFAGFNSWTNGTNVNCAPFTVIKATPSAYFANVNSTGTHTLTSGDLGASFTNPYSGGVASPTGTVSYAITSATSYGSGSNGTGAVGIGTVLMPGQYTITASYPGDGNYNAAGVTAIFTINDHYPFVVTSVSPTTINFGQTTTVTSVATDADGNLYFHGILHLNQSGSDWNRGSMCDHSTGWGNHPIGTDILSASYTTGSISGSSNTMWIVHQPTWVGTHTYHSNASDSYFWASSDSGNWAACTGYAYVTVNKATPTGTFTARTLVENAPNGYAVAAGDRNASFANPDSGSVSQPTGVISYAIAPGSPAGTAGTAIVAGTLLTPGTYTIRASYPGDSNYNPATIDATWTVVNPPPDNVSVTVGELFGYGQSIPITTRSTDSNGDLINHHIVVSNAAYATNNWEGSDPSGWKWHHFMTAAAVNGSDSTVTFNLRDDNYGQGPNLPPGTYHITINAQDTLPNYTYNASNVMAAFTVVKATPNGSFSGKSVTGTYTLSSGDLGAIFTNPYPGGAIAPTGTISYSITSTTGNGASPATGTVAVGTVLYPGTYTIQASYPGDDKYNAATANATFTVGNQTPTITISANTYNINFGQSVTVTATGNDPDGNLYNVAFMSYNVPAGYSRPGNVTYNRIGWTGYPIQPGWSGQTFSDDTASGYGPVTKSATWQPQSGAVGTWSFLGYVTDTTGTQAEAWTLGTSGAALTVGATTPTGIFSNTTKSPQAGAIYTIQAGDLNATFANPYSGGVAAPTGATTYTIAPSSPNGVLGVAINPGTTLTGGLTYVVRATIASDGNYNSNIVDSTWTINQGSQTSVSISSPPTATYGSPYTAIATGGSGTGVIVWALGTGSTASGAAIDSATGLITANSMGTVVIKAYRASDTNYLISAPTADFTVTVGARPITVTLTGSRTYDGTTASTGASASITGGSLAGGDTITYAYVPTSSANAGSYGGLATATVSNASVPTTRTTSYAITYAGNYTINRAAQAAVSITSANATTYGNPYTATASGGSGTGAIVWALGTGSTASGAAVNSSTGVITANSTGTVIIKAYRAGDTNYLASATTTNFTVTVGARAITVTLAGSKTYNGTTAPTGASASISGGSLAGGDTITYAYAPTSSANAGGYAGLATATVNNASAPTTRTTSYAITYAGSYTINRAAQAAVSITSANSTTYGNPYTATASGGSGTGAIVWALGTGSTASGAAVNSSTGVITANSTGMVVIRAYRAADINYLASATTSFVVNVGARAITVTLTGSKTYDGTTAPLGAAASITSGSLAGTDTISFSYSATSGANAGNYGGLTTAAIANASAPTARSGSYSITYAGFYIINKAPLTITAASKTKGYGAANPTLTASYSAFVNGESLSVVTGLNLATNADTTSGVGTYPITASGATAANYAITYVNGTLTVTKADPNLQAGAFPATKSVTVANTYLVSAADLNAVFVNPYTAGVTQPGGAVTYLISNGSPPGSFATIFNGQQAIAPEQTALRAGIYTIQATSAADANYNAATRTMTLTVALDPNADADGDGMPNGWEVDHNLNPYVAADASQDADNDGVTNLVEYQLGLDPTDPNDVIVQRFTYDKINQLKGRPDVEQYTKDPEGNITHVNR